MSVDDSVNVEVSNFRPREVIESDLAALQGQFKILDSELNPLQDKIGTLPDEHKTAMDSLASRLEKEELDDDELSQIVSKAVLPVAREVRAAMGRYKQLMLQESRLESEMTPYRKKDFERFVKEVSARINYNAVFEYYNDKSRSESGSDLLGNTTSQLYELRRFQHDFVMPNGEERDFNFYDFRCHALESFSKEWEEKGFLYDEPLNEFQINRDFGEPATIVRTQLVGNLDEIMGQLEQFNKLKGTYHHSLSSWYPYDFQLSMVQSVLKFIREWHVWGYKDFEQLDFDPAFIEEARTYVEKIVEGHRKDGHLPPTEETLQIERQRIDAIEDDKQINGVKAEGFEAPGGMVAVVTPQEVLSEVRKLLPPDFFHRLRAISHKNKPEKSPDEDPNVETVGTFIPIFNDDKKLVAVEIEVYKELFTPQDTSGIDRAIVRAEFMGTVWHEFGHNAHHMLRYDEMQSWEDVVTRDNSTAITLNVMYAREDNQIRGKREDFADSFRLFVTNPALLHTLSTQRYQFMFDYFNRRLKTDQHDSFKTRLDNLQQITYSAWEYCGYSQDDIRRMYLSH